MNSEEITRFNEMKSVFFMIRLATQNIGLVGNFLMFVVYSRVNLRKLSVSTYFRCQAVSSACQNVLILAAFFLNFSFINSSELACKLTNLLINIFSPLSAWFEVAASVDRFLTIVFRNNSKFFHKPFVQALISLGVLVFNLAFCSDVLIENKLIQLSKNHFTCTTSFRSWLNTVDFVCGLAVPFILMIVFSVATFVSVRNARLRIVQSSTSRTFKRDVKFGITMIVLNMTFLLFNVPYRLSNLVEINPFARHSFIWSFLFNSFVIFLYECYNSASFFVHLIVNSLVRSELRGFLSSLFGCITHRFVADRRDDL